MNTPIPTYAMNHSSTSSLRNNMENTMNKLSDHQFIHKSRKYMYHFSGSFDLFGPELICSVRNAIIDVANRSDIMVVNTTKINANSAIDMRLNRIIQDSVFCLGKLDIYVHVLIIKYLYHIFIFNIYII